MYGCPLKEPPKMQTVNWRRKMKPVPFKSIGSLFKEYRNRDMEITKKDRKYSLESKKRILSYWFS